MERKSILERLTTWNHASNCGKYNYEARREFLDSKRLAYVSESAGLVVRDNLERFWPTKKSLTAKVKLADFPLSAKPMRQWMLRITAYAERLIQDLDTIDWTDSLKEMQRNWIGRSEGAEVDFQI